uniref:Transmembrane protein n=1 Tax=Meloidogyne floridensis TaxID=298350 RepID=A0A915NX19_9BILA
MSSFEYNNTSRSENNAKTVASAYMAMKQSNNYSKSSSTPHGLINIENKRRRKSKESMIGSTAARLFLFFYVALSACGVIFGSVATMVWILVPLVVVPLAAYSLSRHSSKCLYPFLVISVINSIVTFCMALIVGGFSLLCFEQLKNHFGPLKLSPFKLRETVASQPSLKHFSTSLQASDSFIPFFDNSNSSSMTTFIYCALTILSSLLLSLFFFWQSIVLFSCITYFDVLAQQRKQHEQQLKQSVAAGIESRVHSLASAPTEIRGTQSAVIGGKMECSQCISEIRQLDQFSELKASFRQC